MRFAALTMMVLWMQACAQTAPVETVQDVDLARYQGTWFEIARKPIAEEEGCSCTTAHYEAQSDGTIAVTNRCVRDGEDVVATATARVVGPGQLEVTFFWPFTGDYNILALDDDYQWALVGSRNRGYAWILARGSTLDEDVKSALVAELERQGYETSDLIQVEHDGCGS